MADVEDHSALLRSERRRRQSAVLHDIGEVTGEVGEPRIAMGENVAWPQQIKDLRHQRPCFHSTNVAHHLGAGTRILARANRTFERLQPILGDHILRHAHLRA